MNHYRELSSSCDICLSSGYPSIRRRISLTHVNESFNDEIQADFTVTYYKGRRMVILNLVDMGTGFGERGIAHENSAVTMVTVFQSLWIYVHGAPRHFRSDQ